jgi:hypothetical protein
MRKPPLLAAFAGLAMLTAIAPAAGAEETPKAFLDKLYAAYVGPDRPGLMVDSDKVLARYLTPDVIKLMDKMYAASEKVDEVPALDGDPFVDGQEWDIKSFDITVDQSGNDKAIGHVHFKNYDQEKSLTLSLVHLKSGWRIDDIDWSDGTLRKLITEPQPN